MVDKICRQLIKLDMVKTHKADISTYMKILFSVTANFSADKQNTLPAS